MTAGPESKGERAEEIFAEFIRNRGALGSSEFAEWVKRFPDYEEELRALHDALRRIEPHLPESPEEAASDESLELEREHEVLEELGRGAYGCVYRARDPVLERDVALKVLGSEVGLSQRMRRRFLEEARVLARLDHPGIVRIHSIEPSEGAIRLSLELVSGRTLKQIVEEDGPFSAAEAARIGVELCSALAAIHGAGLVHLDVKPGNVMRSEGGRIVLLDFGFARPTEGEVEAPLGGTPPFMSPECFERPERVGPRSDVYSLGVLLYWIASGRYPFDFEDLGGLRERILAGDALPLLDARADLDPSFVAVVERAMARDEAERFATAGEVERALRGLSGGVGGLTPAPRFSRRAGLAAGGVAAAGLIYAGFKTWVGAAGLDVDARFFRIRDEKTEELHEGSQLRLRDDIYLMVQANTSLYVYVFNMDNMGFVWTLFPDDDSHPLAAGKAHRLPRGNDGRWTVSSPSGGREQFLVVASKQPNTHAETYASTFPRPERFEDGVRVVDVNPEDLPRGVGEKHSSSRKSIAGRFEDLGDIQRLIDSDSGSVADFQTFLQQFNAP